MYLRHRPLHRGLVIGFLIGLSYAFVLSNFASQWKWWRGADRRNYDVSMDMLLMDDQAIYREQRSRFDAQLPPAAQLQKIEWLLAVWEASAELGLRYPWDEVALEGMQQLENISTFDPPHVVDCAARIQEYEVLDSRTADGGWPPWLPGKVRVPGFGAGNSGDAVYLAEQGREEILGNRTGLLRGPFPPWVEGADEDNLPMTRRVQRDLWFLQHPTDDCRTDDVSFLIASWEHKNLGGSAGDQIEEMVGMLAMAVAQNRILVMENVHLADHHGCEGQNNKEWSCYFAPETTLRCRQRAFDLMRNEEAVAQGRVLRVDNIPLNSKIWMDPDLGGPPSLWGTPWKEAQPTAEMQGELMDDLETDGVQWWRAQALRYLVRFPSEYTCSLMNKARHQAFGARAASHVLRSQTWDDGLLEGPMERWVWKGAKPWVPKPLVSMHVTTMGAHCAVDLKAYMMLANRLRKRFPHINDIWLSTQIQAVVDGSREYPNWNFYHSHEGRQRGTAKMQSFWRDSGADKATNMMLVDLLVADEADYFVGDLDSAWCNLINGMRSTGGKHVAGYLSVSFPE